MKSGTVDKDVEAVSRLFLSRISDRYDVASAILYGSRARGTHRTDSDVDLAVLLNGEPGDAVDTALAMSDVAYDVLLETGFDISPLPLWLEDWEHPELYSNPALLRAIDEEGVWL